MNGHTHVEWCHSERRLRRKGAFNCCRIHFRQKGNVKLSHAESVTHPDWSKMPVLLLFIRFTRKRISSVRPCSSSPVKPNTAPNVNLTPLPPVLLSHLSMLIYFSFIQIYPVLVFHVFLVKSCSTCRWTCFHCVNQRDVDSHVNSPKPWLSSSEQSDCKENAPELHSHSRRNAPSDSCMFLQCFTRVCGGILLFFCVCVCVCWFFLFCFVLSF